MNVETEQDHVNQSHDIQPESLAKLTRDTFVAEARFHNEVDSTNTVALRLISDNLSLVTPTLIYADRQTAGRGRGDHQWWTTTGSLTFTLIIDAEQMGLSPGQHPQLSLLTAVALANTVRSLLPAVTVGPGGPIAVKWPNDVYVGGRKLAGILLETVANRPSMHVIGIGINVNNTFADAPADVRAASISLAECANSELDRLAFLRSLLQQMEVGFNAFARDPQSLGREWRLLCLLAGKTVSIDVGGTAIAGVCRGIDPTGALLVETDQGLRSLHSGTVCHWI